jgi:hypothetical protein
MIDSGEIVLHMLVIAICGDEVVHLIQMRINSDRVLHDIMYQIVWNGKLFERY